MIQKMWSGQNKLYWLLTPLSLVYGLVTALRRTLFQSGFFKVWRAPVPVVVVGNLTVGGNGKTPVVVYLVEQLQAAGYRVGVISRGYGGKSPYYPLIVSTDTTPAEAGDEPVLIYQRTQAPVAVAPKRADAAQALLAHYELDILITDDGLQHYALARDIELVVIDSHNGFGNGWLLPAGPMRETAARLQTVDAVILNGQQPTSAVSHYRGPIFTLQLMPGHAVNLLTGETCDVRHLPHVQAMAGIGHPARFFSMLTAMAVKVEGQHAFTDHHHFSLSELSPLANQDQTLLMTEKDAVKCRAFAAQNWWYLPIEADIDSALVAAILSKLNIN